MIAFIDDHREAYGLEPICKVLPIAPSTYHAYVAQRLRRRIRATVDALFDRVDCLLSPVSPDLPPLLSEQSTGDFSFLAACSMLGLPAFSVPAGLTDAGLPLAIQLATQRGHDERAIQAAAWSEAVLGRLPPPPL